MAKAPKSKSAQPTKTKSSKQQSGTAKAVAKKAAAKKAGKQSPAKKRAGTTPNPAARAEEPPPGQRTAEPSGHADRTVRGGETHQIATGGGPRLTTREGAPVADNQNSMKVGDREPTLMEDFVLRGKIFHFDHERIPERVVHARGYGAHGVFETYEPISDLTSADLFQRAGEETPVFVRFSTVAGNKGSFDLARDVRGFAVKFYTQEGNWDLVGNNIPVFFIQDAMKFPDLVHAVKAEPDRDYPRAQSAHDNFWDFASLMPDRDPGGCTGHDLARRRLVSRRHRAHRPGRTAPPSPTGRDRRHLGPSRSRPSGRRDRRCPRRPYRRSRAGTDRAPPRRPCGGGGHRTVRTRARPATAHPRRVRISSEAIPCERDESPRLGRTAGSAVAPCRPDALTRATTGSKRSSCPGGHRERRTRSIPRLGLDLAAAWAHHRLPRHGRSRHQLQRRHHGRRHGRHFWRHHGAAITGSPRAGGNDVIRHDWNALQVGHHVLVHDEADSTLGLTPGRVTQVDHAPGSNDVTIRISPRKGPTRVVQPRRLAVHLDTGEPTERCWRCETHYAAELGV